MGQVEDLKLTANQERFCHAYVKTGKGEDAYREAYGHPEKRKHHKNRANDLLKNPNIRTRIEAIRNDVLDETKFTFAEAVERYQVIFEKGMQDGQLNACNRAIENLCALHGMLDKKAGGTDLQPDQARDIAKSLLRSAGILAT